MTPFHRRRATELPAIQQHPNLMAEEECDDNEENSSSMFINRRRANTADGYRIQANVAKSPGIVQSSDIFDEKISESTTFVSSPHATQVVKKLNRPSVTWKN